MSDSAAAIKSYPEISLEVMKRRIEGQYRLWLLARHLDTRGVGWVTRFVLRRFIRDEGLFTMKTVERALANDSVFWEKSGRRIYLKGILKVADALDVTLHDRPTWLPIEDFGSMLTLRQAFIASYFAHMPKTIAIATLATLTGRERRAVTRYLSSHHIIKAKNAMVSVRNPAYDLTPEQAAQGYFHSKVGGRYCLLKRLPNTYDTDLEPAAFGKVKAQQREPSLDPSGEPKRRYFSKAKAASRAAQALSPDETIFALLPGGRDIHGFQLWNGYTCVDRSGEVVSL